MSRLRINLRIVVVVIAVVVVLLFSVAIILLGYGEAASHSIGPSAPIGQPTNIKTK